MPPDSSCVRLAFCITDLDAGGAERALVQLVRRLDTSRWEPHVFCLAGWGELASVLQAAGIPCTCLGARRSRDAAVVWRLARALKAFGPRLLQTFLFHANLAGRLAGRLAGVETIVSGIRVAERRRRGHLWLDRLTNGLVDHNVCVSHGVAEYSIQVGRLQPQKITTIANGVDVERFEHVRQADRSIFGIPADAGLVLSVGRLDPQKGWLFLLDALSQLVARGHNLYWLLVGEGRQADAIERRAAELNIAGRVKLVGRRSDVPELLKAADCFVLPSLWEGMPNVVLEAMAAGLPVVATRVEGSKELVIDGQTGFLATPRSAHDLACGIATLLTHPETARQMGQAGHDLVKSQYSWEKMASQYEALYQSLLEKHERHH